MVVLAFAALVLAVMMSTAWKLRAQAKGWQDQAAQLNTSTAHNMGDKASLTLRGGGVTLSAAGSCSRSAGGLLSVWVHYPSTMDWSALTESKVAAKDPPPAAAGDPLALAAPQKPSAAFPSDSFSGSASTEGGAYAPAMAASAIKVDQHASVVLRQEFLYLAGGADGSGDISSAYEKGGSPGSLTVLPASGNGQPLLVYVAGPLTVNCIVKEQGIDSSLRWEPGWYAVPAGTDLLDLGYKSDIFNNWRLDYSGVLRENGSRPGSNADLTAAERAALAQRLDEAYARLVLAGASFEP